MVLESYSPLKRSLFLFSYLPFFSSHTRPRYILWSVFLVEFGAVDRQFDSSVSESIFGEPVINESVYKFTM